MSRRTSTLPRSAVKLPAHVFDRLGNHVADITTVQRGGLLEARRWFSIESREVDEEAQTATLAGYSTTFDKPYEVYGGASSGLGWDETMAAGAWSKTLAERSDILFLENHEGRALARVSNGTLRLTEDELGVYNEVTLDMRRTDARDVYLAVERGDMCEMSCAFRVVKDRWEDDFTKRTIFEVIGYDSSVVNYPANPNTLIMATSADLPADEVEPREQPTERGMSLRAARLELERMRRRVA